jgi:hypothetical protein
MIKIKKYQIEDYISDATQSALDLKADLVDGKVPESQLPDFATNLSYTPGVSNGIVNSDTGTSATIPLAGIINAGLFSAAEKLKLDGINAQNLQEVTNEGAITTNTMTVDSVNYYSLLQPQAIRTENKITGSYTFLDGDGVIGISNGTSESKIRNTNTTHSGIILEFPNKIGGSYTIATIEDYSLQSVTDIGASTTNPITINVGEGGLTGIYSYSSQGFGVKGESNESSGVYGVSNGAGVYGDGAQYGVYGVSPNTGVYGDGGTWGVYGNSGNVIGVYARSDYGTGLYGYSETGVGISAYSTENIGLEVNGNGTIAIEANLGNSNKGLVINSGTSSTGNPITVNKNGVDKLTIDQEGVITSNSIFASSINDYGVSGTSTNSDAISGESSNGNGVVGISVNGVGGVFMTTNNANIAEFNTNFVLKASIDKDGDINANSFVKEGGGDAELLAANGTVVTAGTNITIANGEISALGSSGGSSSVNFYLNGSIASGVAGYQQIGSTAVIGGGTDFTLAGNGTIAQFLTNVGSPNRLEIPAGAWNFELWLQSNVNNSATNVYVELYKYNGAFTLLASNVSNPINLQTNTNTNLYITNLAIPQTTLVATDRLAVKVIAINSLGAHSVTLHTEDGNICEIITNFVGGIVSINGLTQPTQTLATGTTGNNFAISSSGSTHTFNLPDASATARGVVTTGTQTFGGAKTFTSSGSTAITGNSTEQAGITGTSVEGTGIVGTSIDDVGVYGGSINAIGGVFNTENGTTIVEFQTNSVLKATVNSDGTFAGTGLNASDQTINTIASFDGSKNVVSLSTANGYPTLTELKSLVGVSTTAIQTQLNNKQDKSLSAYTIMANNTNATADATAQVYKYVGQQTYTATPTWSGAAPTNILANTYGWSQIGSTVNVRISLSYNTGQSSTSVILPMPADMPAPASITGFTGNSDILAYGSGMMLNATTSTAVTGARNCLLRRNTSGGYEFFVNVSIAVTTKVVIVNLTYFA